jgi:hypothetical protein
MAKLHELLAVETSVGGNYSRDLGETLKTLGKHDMFTRTVTRKTHFSNDDSRLDTSETKEMASTVAERLNWYKKSVTDFFDLILQKDKTNQNAKVDLTVDGTIIASDIPATTLLMLESKLQDVRKVMEATPTLPVGISWDRDENENLWKNREPKVTFSTKRTTKPVILYDATKEHPAQVKEVAEDIPVAKITQDTYSGMITSAQKAKVLGRLDILLQACKKARQQANQEEVVNGNLGANIFKYLFDKDI